MEKTLIIVAYIGTTDRDIIDKEINPFLLAIKQANAAGEPLLAFTAEKNCQQLAKQGITIYTLQEAIDFGLEQGYDSIQVLPLHLVVGENYNEMKELVHSYDKKLTVVLLEPLLQSSKSCHDFLQAFSELLGPVDSKKQVLLVGHGASSDINQDYKQLIQQLREHQQQQLQEQQEQHLTGDVMKWQLVSLRQSRSELLDLLHHNTSDEVVLFPLFVTAGYHVKNDVLEGHKSIRNSLEVSGFKVKAYTKGLISYEVIKKLYINKINIK